MDVWSVKIDNVRVPVQVSLLGHSAGGQMCAMALLHRAKALSKHTKLGRRSNGHQQDSVPARERMPARFIGSLPFGHQSTGRLLETMTAYQ